MHALVVGAGAQGQIVVDILRARNEYDMVEFIDDKPELKGRVINEAPVSGDIASLSRRRSGSYGLIVAIGNPILRLRLAERLRDADAPFLNAIHPSVVVMASARLGHGLMIHPGAVINTMAQLGDHVLVNTSAVVEHDVVADEGATVSAGALIAGRVRLGRACFVGSGATIVQRRTIGAGSIVAAGSVVTHDVPPGVLVMGTPARVREEVGPDFNWNRLL